MIVRVVSKRAVAAWVVCLCAVLVAAGCSDSDEEPQDAGLDASPSQPSKSASPNSSPPPPAMSTAAIMVECGSEQCTATSSDTEWGGEPCCLDADSGECGVKSDNIAFDNPLDGSKISIQMALETIGGTEGDGGTVGTTNPTISCQAKGQAGELSDECPDAELTLGGDLVDTFLGDGGALAGMVEIPPGCCRPEGKCGYMDGMTGFGCVLRSESLIGQVNGDEDMDCEPDNATE